MQSVYPELTDSDEHEDLSGLETPDGGRTETTAQDAQYLRLGRVIITITS